MTGLEGQHLNIAVPCNAKLNQLFVWFMTPLPLQKRRPYVMLWILQFTNEITYEVLWGGFFFLKFVGKYDIQPLLLLYPILIKWPSLFILFFVHLGRAQGYKNMLFSWPWLVLSFDTHHLPDRERALMREPTKHRTSTFVIKKEVRSCHSSIVLCVC